MTALRDQHDVVGVAREHHCRRPHAVIGCVVGVFGQSTRGGVDVDGEDYTTVALDFLKEENLIAD